MSAWGSIGSGTRALILALGGGAVVGTGYLVWRAAYPVETAVVAEGPAQTANPATSPDVSADVAAPSVAEQSDAAAPALPKIDTWRVAPDGEALVAGLALPGATVEVVVDDRPVAGGVALASGEFVLQFTLPPNPEPSLLWLSMTSPEGIPVTSPEMVAIAPILGPKLAVADDALQPDPEPEGSTEIADDIAQETAPEAELATDAAPATLLLNAEGVAVQQGGGADPAFAKQVMIDTISYSPGGAVQVGGRGDADAGLRLYLDNAEVAVATVKADGLWQVTLGDTAPGIYSLRVDQMDATGKVTSRFETPFKRETLESLALAAGSAQAEAPVADGDPVADLAAEANPAVEEPAPDTAAETPAEVVVASEPSAGTEPASAPVPEVEPAAPAPSGPVALAETAPPPPVTITVQPGFTLWGIAQERFGDGVFYVQVFDANRDKIKDPNLIYPGQVFSIPAGLSP